MLVEKNNIEDLRAVGTKLKHHSGLIYQTPVLVCKMHYYIALVKPLSKSCPTPIPRFTSNA
jgi:hypothetical protein